jgi:hypothetical protein
VKKAVSFERIDSINATQRTPAGSLPMNMKLLSLVQLKQSDAAELELMGSISLTVPEVQVSPVCTVFEKLGT